MKNRKKQDSFRSNYSLKLLESSKSGKTWKVMILEPGLSKNGKFYSPEILQKAKDLFEGAKVCYYEFKKNFFNHIPPAIQRAVPAGFPKQIAGWLENVQYEELDFEGKKIKGLTGILHLHDGVNWLRDMLKNTWEKGKKQFWRGKRRLIAKRLLSC